MSWHAYIDNLTSYTDVNGGAICSKEGAIWAKSTNCLLTDDQSKKLAERLKGASTDTSLSVGDVKYMILTSDANGIQARKDKNAFSCSTSTTAIVIACHIHSSDAKDPTPGLNQRLGTASEKIAEYLSQSGY